ncbi:hypothetical protein C5167_012827 [Papaver somniferum]|uniref:Uncharacterized protein n=1 Tax=Papaver somniferum TaxID=3469 RepID=A0A4Y7J2L6_PAPSO|nr:hypothetical protein C5167_012827 [Papaver somniferum]
MDGVRRCVARIHKTNCGDITADDLNERQVREDLICQGFAGSRDLEYFIHPVTRLREAGVDDEGEVIEISKCECIIWLAKGYLPSISVHIGAPGIQVYILMHLQQDE